MPVPFHNQTVKLIFAVGLLIVSATAHGNQNNIDNISVTASRLESTVSEIVQTVEIVSRDDIDKRQLASVTELLRHITGANVIQQGGRGGVTSLVIRGGDANFTTVQIDGVKVNDPTNTRGGSYDFSYLNIANIKRVEIVRGPMSALYGSDALSGVVNIITRDSSDGSQLGFELGGHGLRSLHAAVGGTNGVVGGTVSVSLLSEDGDIQGGGYEDKVLNGALRLAASETTSFGVSIRHLDANSTNFPEDSGGPLFAVNRGVDRRSVTESHVRLYIDHRIEGDWFSKFAIVRYERTEDYASPGIAPGMFNGIPANSAMTDFIRNQLTASLGRDFSDTFSVLIGGEWQDENGRSVGLIDVGFPLSTEFSLSRKTISAFLEAKYRHGRTLLHGSIRWDDPEDFDNETSAQFGILYDLVGNLGQIRLTWGQGFKTPSFFSLGHPIVGNPDLRSETAESVEIGFKNDLPFSDGQFEINIYRNRYTDLIDFDPILFSNVNRSEVISQGVEVTATIAFRETVKVSGHLTYMDADIQNSDARLRGRPQWRGGAQLDWKIRPKWRFVASLLSMTEYWEVSIPTAGMYLEGYTRLDLALSYSATDRWRIGFAVDNVLDRDYQEAIGFPAPGVRARLNTLYRF